MTDGNWEDYEGRTHSIFLSPSLTRNQLTTILEASFVHLLQFTYIDLPADYIYKSHTIHVHSIARNFGSNFLKLNAFEAYNCITIYKETHADVICCFLNQLIGVYFDKAEIVNKDFIVSKIKKSLDEELDYRKLGLLLSAYGEQLTHTTSSADTEMLLAYERLMDENPQIAHYRRSNGFVSAHTNITF